VSPSPPRFPLWVALRAVVWSALFAGTVAVYIPWRYFGVTLDRVRPTTFPGIAGLILLAAGVALMLACVGEFVARGRGTPAPMDAPRELVVHGPYRVVRNPMYVGMVLTLLGELAFAWSRGFALYIVGWFAIINLVVILYEEPTLRRKFSGSYERYTREVGRWWPKVPR
jgi:protein-S-isoprenylcysteine O-methyltransferase Ste14